MCLFCSTIMFAQLFGGLIITKDELWNEIRGGFWKEEAEDDEIGDSYTEGTKATDCQTIQTYRKHKAELCESGVPEPSNE